VKAIRKGSDSSAESYVFTASVRGDVNCPTARVRVGQADTLTMLIDSGASENIVDTDTVAEMKKKLQVERNNKRLYAYADESPLTVVGVAKNVRFSVNGRSCNASVVVVKGKHGCLLSFATARALGLFETESFSSAAVNQVTSGRYAKLIERYPDLFTSKVGLLKGYEATIHIDKTIKPTLVPHRRHPYHLIEAADRALDELEVNDVIEKLTKPSEWSSPIVIVPKPKKPGEVQITVDSRAANKAVKRIKYVCPTLKEIMYDLNGATHFSLIDLNKAFHQIVLDERSRDITAISTHRGQYRFKRLHMGVSSASEIFQDALQQRVLYGLKGVKNLADDILIWPNQTRARPTSRGRV